MVFGYWVASSVKAVSPEPSVPEAHRPRNYDGDRRYGEGEPEGFPGRHRPHFDDSVQARHYER